MRKRKIAIYLTLLIVLLLAGCHTKQEEDEKGPFLFYINGEGTALKRKACKIKGSDREDKVKNMLEELKKAQNSVEIQAPIPQKVKVLDFELEEQKLHLNMNREYLQMNKVREVLCRAAIVQTLTQIDGIEQIDFAVEKKPLLNENKEPIGPLSASSFVQDTGTALNSYQKAELTLFFANEKGDGLVSENVNVRYLSNVSPEQLIIEQLMKGPEKKGAKPILSPKTKILSVSVKDGICYVNFDKHFLNPTYDVEPKIVIYGIVNSILSNGNLSKVQISVEGKTAIKFQESVNLNEPLERNLELVELK